MSASKRTARLALGSIPVAILVMGMKYVAYDITGSAALYSDALESVVNVMAALAAAVAIFYARRPADASHPYGHHKAEYFSAVLEGVLIVIAALLIFEEAVLVFLHPRALTNPAEGFAVNIVAGVINGVWALMLIRVGRADRSPALVADGRHIMTDVWTSVGVIVGLLLSLATGWLWLDPLMAMLVAVNIVREGWLVISESVDGLMDRAVPDHEAERIRTVIHDNARGAIEAHDIKTRFAGRATFVEFHLVVAADMTVETSHRICDAIEAALMAEIPGARVTIHVEPDHKEKGEGVRME
jgi:cation diffusion facilitator family transporter